MISIDHFVGTDGVGCVDSILPLFLYISRASVRLALKSSPHYNSTHGYELCLCGEHRQ